MRRAWLGIDQGTTATKACLLDRRGRIRRLVTVPVTIRHPASGRAEQDGDEIFRSVGASLRRLLRGIDPATVAAAGLACQRSSFLIWEPESGRPLTPVLSWQDRRGEDLCHSLRRHEGWIRRRTGLRLSPHYAASKIRWLLDHAPSLRRRAERGEVRGGTLDAYLLHRLTGGDSWSTDPTHAARTLLMDLRRQEWDPALLDLFRVPRPILPPIRPSAFPAGEIRLPGISLRIAATAGDQQAALIGLGCRKPREAAANYGTGAFVVLGTGSRPARVKGLLTSVAWSSERTTRYLLEGTVNAAGSALDWIRRNLGSAPSVSAPGIDLRRIPVVVPSFSGLGAPYWLSGARGAIVDLELATTPEDLAAGAMAGIALRVGEILETMAANGFRPRRLVAGGGMARQPGFLPLQAAFLGRRVERALAGEGTCRGAAILAGHSAGDWNLETDALLEFPAAAVPPGAPAAAVRAYRERFRSARCFAEARSVFPQSTRPTGARG